MKLETIKTSNGKVAAYKYGAWQIMKHGGVITMTRWHAGNYENEKCWFWKFTRKEVIETINQIESGKMTFEEIESLYRNPLYN